jgi:hypothetical protein
MKTHADSSRLGQIKTVKRVSMPVLGVVLVAALVSIVGVSPAAATSYPLSSVSCTTSSFCAAVDTNGDALIFAGKTWREIVKTCGSIA